MNDAMKSLIAKAADEPLTRAEAEQAFDTIFSGDATPVQIAAFLMALRTRGESVDEITAAAGMMRRHSVKVNAPEGAIDIVGTGGSGKHTLNISTASIFTVAGAGVPVAKHGNRNITSKSGTADVQTALGINVMAGPDVMERAMYDCGVGFMMAPVHHPGMKYVMPVRGELGTRTIFNILGPLTSPASVKRQLTGAATRDRIVPMAETLNALESEKAWIVHGSDGTDELTITGTSYVASLEDGSVSEIEIHPDMAGLPTHPFEDTLGGTPEENAKALLAVLGGQSGAYRDAVLLNSAAALLIAGKVNDLPSGVELARESLDSGAAQSKLDALIQITNAG